MTRRMLRGLTKTGIASALHWSGGARTLSAVAGWRGTPPVVTYHRVVADFAASAQRTPPAMLISARMLEQHLDWIGRRFRFVSLDELGSHLEGRVTSSRPIAAITFDDGYRDVYEHAFPLLKRKGIPAAIFAVTGLIGTSELQLHDRVYLLMARALNVWESAEAGLAGLLKELDVPWPHGHTTPDGGRDAVMVARALRARLPQAEVLRVCAALETRVGLDADDSLNALLPLTWDMLAEMQRAGMTIGSHTTTHPMLTNESARRVLAETAESRHELERRLGIAVKHFAYPAGCFDLGVVSAVAAAGYLFGYTTCQHRDRARPLLTIPRRLFWQNSCLDAFGEFSSTMMSCQVKGSFDFGRGCNHAHVDIAHDTPAATEAGTKDSLASSVASSSTE